MVAVAVVPAVEFTVGGVACSKSHVAGVGELHTCGGRTSGVVGCGHWRGISRLWVARLGRKGAVSTAHRGETKARVGRRGVAGGVAEGDNECRIRFSGDGGPVQLVGVQREGIRGVLLDRGEEIFDAVGFGKGGAGRLGHHVEQIVFSEHMVEGGGRVHRLAEVCLQRSQLGGRNLPVGCTDVGDDLEDRYTGEALARVREPAEHRWVNGGLDELFQNGSVVLLHAKVLVVLLHSG